MGAYFGQSPPTIEITKKERAERAREIKRVIGKESERDRERVREIEIES